MKLIRFTKTERVLHWSFAIPVILLVLTGITMIAVSVLGLTESIQKADIVRYHVIFGFLLMIMPVLVFFRGERKVLLDNLKGIVCIDSKDRLWLKQTFLKIFKKEIELPDCGKFNAGQKLNTIITMFLVVSLSLSGLSMLIIKGSLLSNIIHAALAFIFLFSFAGHLFLALINPSTRHAFYAITTGRVNADWLKKHHRRMYQDMVSGTLEK